MNRLNMVWQALAILYIFGCIIMNDMELIWREIYPYLDDYNYISAENWQKVLAALYDYKEDDVLTVIAYYGIKFEDDDNDTEEDYDSAVIRKLPIEQFPKDVLKKYVGLRFDKLYELHKNGDKDALTALFVLNIGLIFKIAQATNIRNNNENAFWEITDLFQEGVLDILVNIKKYLDKFDETRYKKFENYLSVGINRGMTKAVKKSKLIQAPRAKIEIIKKIMDKLDSDIPLTEDEETELRNHEQRATQRNASIYEQIKSMPSNDISAEEKLNGLIC